MEWALAFRILEQGLKLWNTKESRKYLDRVIELKKDWHEEYNRPDRSQLALDSLERELRIIAESFASLPGQNTDPSP